MDQLATPTVRGRTPWRDLVLLVGMATVASTTISLSLPLFAVVLTKAGEDSAMVGWVSAVGGIGIFIVAPFVDGMLRRLGAVGTMRTALLVAAGTLLLFPVHVSVWTWLPLRLLLGCAGALLFVISEASVNALAPAERRGQVLAAYATFFSLGYATGPILLASVGSAGWTPFLVASALLAASALPLAGIKRLDATLKARPAGGGGRSVLALVRSAPLAYAGILVYGLVETAFFTFLPVWGMRGGLDESTAAWLLSAWLAGNILLQLPVGWLADRYPRAWVLAGCAQGAGLLLLATPPLVGTAWIWVAMVGMGGLMGATYTISLSMIGDRFGPADLTRANTGFVMVFHIGLLIGPAAIGLVLRSPWPPGFAVALALPLAALALGSAWAARTQGTNAAAAPGPAL